MYIDKFSFKNLADSHLLIAGKTSEYVFVDVFEGAKSESEVGLSPKILLPSKLGFVDFRCPRL
jgi:hypothetical protein